MQNTGSTAARQKTMKTRSWNTRGSRCGPCVSTWRTRCVALAGRLSRIQTAIMTTMSVHPAAAERNSTR